MQKIKQIMALLNGIDPYEMLNSSPLQDFSILKKNYRSLALKYHPDRSKQASSKQKFIQINLAYQFLQQQTNRQIYINNIKAIEQQKLREQQMTQDRKRILYELKKRQEQYHQRKKDIDEELRRKKQYFQNKMKQQDERQKLRQQILSEIKPAQFYDQLTSIKVQWRQGLSFSKLLLMKAFSSYGKICSIKLCPTQRQSIITLSSIQLCQLTIKTFKHPQIKIQYLVSKQRREHLLLALKRKNSNQKNIDFSLNSQNLQRLKEVINRTSSVYLDR